MNDTFLSRFTPSLMTHETLEAIFVQREKLAQSLVERIRDSVLTPAKHHVLLVGPRGMGKTHLVALVYHRVKKMDDLADRLRIAWLREEEWGVTSFLDLLLRTLRALHAEHPDPRLAEMTEALYELDADEAERAAADLLRAHVGERTLLLIAENLDEIFKGLGEEGQQQFRALLQNHAFAMTLATAQSLFGGVSLRTSPFYGFFNIQHLPQLSLDDATRLLTKIAEHAPDRELAAFLRTAKGRARVRAVHHLAGGNPRVYLIFSQFLTREALDELVEPFVKMLDDLTPYYQARMAWLSAQQRKIVEFLIENRGAATVKAIAQRSFMTPQTASGQLKTLRDYGYVQAESVGRESYYELSEPLMRLCIEVKKHRGQPIRLLIDFLRLWYTRPELEERLGLLQPEAALEREYVLLALQTMEEETADPIVAASWKDFNRYVEEGNFESALKAAEELVEIRGTAIDWYNFGSVLGKLGRYRKALAAFEQAIKRESQHVGAWTNRGVALSKLGRYEEALKSQEQAIELQPEYVLAWYNRGVVLGNLGRYPEAMEAFERAIELEPEKAQAWTGRGVALQRLGCFTEGLEAFERAIALEPEYAGAWFNHAALLLELNRWGEGIDALNAALDRFAHAAAPETGDTGAILGNLFRSTEGTGRWPARVQALVGVYERHSALAALGQGFVESITAATGSEVAQNVARRWLETWKQQASDREEFQLPLRLLDAAVRYREAEDPRVLLELPVEERLILQEVLGLEEAAEA